MPTTRLNRPELKFTCVKKEGRWIPTRTDLLCETYSRTLFSPKVESIQFLTRTQADEMCAKMNAEGK